MAQKLDKELEEFRSLMEVPSTFDEGFSWKSLAGALFVALLMVPGAIYLGLMAGQGIGPAAQWVTVILFVEVARRAQSALKRAEVWVLFYMAGAAMGTPFYGLLWNQFFVRSQAAQSTGVAAQLPNWVAPAAGSESYAMRQFLHADWLPVIGLIVFTTIVGNLAHLILGYGLFRLTSDVEKLPFPMAPVGAQGIMALAEDSADKEAEDQQNAWRWRVFSIGGALGLAFGAVYLLLPIVTNAMCGTSIQLFTIPFVDTTAKTQNLLPALATGLCWDLGNLLMGMVFPFFSVLGSFAAIVCTAIANPLLYKAHLLSAWMPGDNTIQTLFKNNIDFYFSFGIGVTAAVAMVGFYKMITGLRDRFREAKIQREVISFGSEIPKERGDIKTWIIIACYFVVTLSYIIVSMYLIGWEAKNMRVLVVLLFFGFLYTPLMSYVNARLEAMSGMMVEIPMIREVSLMASGYQGVKIWFLPIPMANYAGVTNFYRQCELTGTRFTSIWKTQIALMPIILISSIFFMNFLWKMADVPSSAYPYASKMWELQAANSCIMYTSTMGDYSIFQLAFKWPLMLIGTGLGLVLFTGLSAFGAPMFLFYGIVGGLGAWPHMIIPQFIGAMIGRFYFQRRLGVQWRQYIPVVLAGYSCGVGLIATLGIGIKFMSQAVVQLPF